ncbi:MAG: HAMP domain-containing histidine kinase [Chitinophagaceae bacterium]|jgi:signal transduction histidine kinase|nr:HAMP domain-containing histidine kinase [Chitinophagaceae bacterium]
MRNAGIWKFLLSVLAVVIVVGTFFYSNFLAEKISERERAMMSSWVTAQRSIASATADDDISLPSSIVAEQRSIPIIETDENDQIISSLNLDSSRAQNDPQYLKGKLQEFKSRGNLITTFFGTDSLRYNRYYFGESLLLRQIRYFPMIQLLIVLIFTIMMLRFINTRNRSLQDRLWAGLAKETAHQLGTPVSALEGWTALLREGGDHELVSNEMDKDIQRLKLITDRFSMIGGEPKKEVTNLKELVIAAVEYMRKRAPETVVFEIINNGLATPVSVSRPLLEWVIENILKNALDAMNEKGRIEIKLGEEVDMVWVEIRDNGKGMAAGLQREIFNPGVTTKKRGWGLGLTLSKRIVEEYHGGLLFVKESMIGQGTTFRIQLKK